MREMRSRSHYGSCFSNVVLSTPITCSHCGYTSEWQGRSVSSRFNEEPRDWYFKLPFFYRASCCGHDLWAFNCWHLDFLREFVGAQLRSRSVTTRGWSNRSLVSRLPRWISAAKHRDEILIALKKIEQMMKKDKVYRSPRTKIHQKWVDEAMVGDFKLGNATRLRRIGARARIAIK